MNQLEILHNRSGSMNIWAKLCTLFLSSVVICSAGYMIQMEMSSALQMVASLVEAMGSVQTSLHKGLMKLLYGKTRVLAKIIL